MSKSKTRKQKPHQYKRVCIFCGGSPLTEQHCIPNWIGREFPEATHPQEKRLGYQDHWINNGDQIIYEPSFKKQQGRIGVKRLKVVCNKCNSEWMSHLENRAKPVIIKLFKNPGCSILREDRKIISSWMILVSIIFEYDQLKTRAISKADRLDFFNNQAPDDKWEIFISRTNNENPYGRRIFHSGALIGSRFDRENAHKDSLMNFQLTLLAIDGLVFVARYLNYEGVTYEKDDFLYDNFTKIWPCGGSIDEDLSSQFDTVIDQKIFDSTRLEDVINSYPKLIANGKRIGL